MVGGRGAIYEQKEIEKFTPNPEKWWKNPQLEMQKVGVLRTMLQEEREFYRKETLTALPKEVPKLREAQREIELVLDLLGTETTAPGATSKEEDDLLKKYPPRQ